MQNMRFLVCIIRSRIGFRKKVTAIKHINSFFYSNVNVFFPLNFLAEVNRTFKCIKCMQEIVGLYSALVDTSCKLLA